MNADPSFVQSFRGNVKSIPTSVNLERLSSESPLEYYRACRSILTGARSGKTPELEKALALALRHPFAKSYQPVIACLAMLSRILGKSRIPIEAPRAGIGDISGAWMRDRLLPMPIANELASLWEEVAAHDQDDELLQKANSARAWIESLGRLAGWLFSPEDVFDENELEEFLRGRASESFGLDRDLGILAFAAPQMESCLTLSGWNTGLGAMRYKDVEIRALGPQRFPLSESDGFGIAQYQAHQAIIEMGSIEGWTRCYAERDIWLHVKAGLRENSLDFETKWVGISPAGGALAFVFYVAAKQCTLEDGSKFLPQNLHRYQGLSQKIIFNESLQISCSEPLRMQVIPLSGSGCFWNTTFLIAFEFTSSQNEASYSFRFL